MNDTERVFCKTCHNQEDIDSCIRKHHEIHILGSRKATVVKTQENENYPEFPDYPYYQDYEELYD